MSDKNINGLEMIQGIINRMGGNSFALKGWSVTLVAALITLSRKDADKMYFLVVYLPIIIFWTLDAYYLQLERKYIKLYNEVRKLDNTEFDFNMDISKFNDDKEDKRIKYLNCLIAPTESFFYIPLAVITTGIIIITNIF